MKTCKHCNKTNFELAEGCKNPTAISPAVGDWVCNKSLHAGTGNTNASKEVTKSSQIQIRCLQSDKALIVRNLKSGETLANFVMGLALAEANKRQEKSSN